jgi:pimeloyl-ACP methyl ester carboxylesterase
MAQLAAHAVRILDALDIERAHVLGASLGGLVAQELAIRFPHRVRTLMLAGTASSGPLAVPAPIGVLAKAAVYMVADSVRRRQLWPGRAVFAADFAARQEADLIIRSMARDFPPAWTLCGQLLAFATHERSRDLGRVRAPTLILHGERDLLVSITNTRRLTAGIPNTTLHVVPGAGHGCLLEQAGPVFDTICDWLDRQDPTAPATRPAALATLTERVTRRAAVPIGIWRVQREALVRLRRT